MFSKNHIPCGDSKPPTVYPYCLPAQTYGTTLFWAEEYWAVMQIQEFKKIYPYVDFSGLFDPYFTKELFSYLVQPIHSSIIGTNKFNDIIKFKWEDKRQFINIATSHAPSRYIAQNYKRRFRDEFGIVTFDAHFDFTESLSPHGAWIIKELAGITTVIGGWAETHHDFDTLTSSFAFIEPNLKQIGKNAEFLNWLRGKKIYISFDLDYCQESQINFLGYSNYWHRNKVIGHSMNLKQMLAEKNIKNQLSRPYLLGKFLGFFSNLETFIRLKKTSLKNQTDNILTTLRALMQLLRKTSATPLCIDLVEYSPVCDWQQLTITELIENYQKYLAVFNS
ncbi:MAG: hypothetical protein ACFFB2_14300 [Promethearchaeota archaeon]